MSKGKRKTYQPTSLERRQQSQLAKKGIPPETKQKRERTQTIKITKEAFGHGMIMPNYYEGIQNQIRPLESQQFMNSMAERSRGLEGQRAQEFVIQKARQSGFSEWNIEEMKKLMAQMPEFSSRNMFQQEYNPVEKQEPKKPDTTESWADNWAAQHGNKA